jgi:serine/threonine protein kinase
MSDKVGSTASQIITFLRKRDYVMVRELGAGACGRTVLLHDDQIDEQFVCKKYSPFSESVRTELFANFTREIKLLHQVHHPNVVRVFNYFLYPDQFTGYLLMEFVDGADVDDFVSAHPEKINDVFFQTLNGFAHLEHAGILHRDIRPGNLMVANDGVVKIIDLGFGKQISESKDFDKSISLNWWCETPEEFNSRRYDFGTEVYFVGKLFEKLIRENSISHFNYTDLLRRMCIHDPDARIDSFSAVLQSLRNDQFTEIDFSTSDRQAYRTFADELCEHVTKIENGAKYVDDLKKITRQLRDAYQKVMLEETVPDSAIVMNCFIDGTYYYRSKGFSVEAIRDFLELLRICTTEKMQILLANVHTRMDAIPRYAGGAPNDDIPF